MKLWKSNLKRKTMTFIIKKCLAIYFELIDLWIYDVKNSSKFWELKYLVNSNQSSFDNKLYFWFNLI